MTHRKISGPPFRVKSFGLFIAYAAVVVALAAQAAPQQSSRPKTPQDPDSDETVRIEADLVSLNVRVTDSAHRAVTGVRREDLQVFEDGVPQTVTLFSTEEVPISYGLVVGYSGALGTQLDGVVEAGRRIVENNRAGDESFIARFLHGDGMRIQWDFTSDKKELREALDSLRAGERPRALVDAVYLSIEHVSEHESAADARRGLPRRRALILVTDGDDRHSFYKQEELFALLRRRDVQIYAVGFVNELSTAGDALRPGRRARAVALLNRLAAETGGRVFYPSTPQALPQIADEIARDLRSQYVVGYSPTNKARDGSFRTVRVAVAPGPSGRVAVARPGYTAPRK